MSKDPQIVFALIVPLFPEKYSVLFLLSKSLMCLINQHLSLTFKFNEFYEFYEFNEFNEFWFGTSLKPKLWQKKFCATYNYLYYQGALHAITVYNLSSKPIQLKKLVKVPYISLKLQNLVTLKIHENLKEREILANLVNLWKLKAGFAFAIS